MGATTVTEMPVTYLREVFVNFSDGDSGPYKSGFFCSLGSIFRPLKKSSATVLIPFLQFAARDTQYFVQGRKCCFLELFLRFT